MKHLPTENKIPRRGVVPCPSTAEVVLLPETFRFHRSFTDKMFELVTASKAGSSFKTWHISATAKRLELPHPLAGCVALVPEGRAGPPITDEKPLFEPLSQGPEATPPRRHSLEGDVQLGVPTRTPTARLCLHQVEALTARKEKSELLNKHGKGGCGQAEPRRKIIKKPFPPNGCFKKTFLSPTYSTLHNSSLLMKMRSPRSPCASPSGG